MAAENSQAENRPGQGARTVEIDIDDEFFDADFRDITWDARQDAVMVKYYPQYRDAGESNKLAQKLNKKFGKTYDQTHLHKRAWKLGLTRRKRK